MGKLWLYFVRTYISIGLFFYYRKIIVKHQENIPKAIPILLVSNHNNALIDPLLIATKSGRFSYFLTRAAVFKKPIISKFLHSLHMLPVYRIRDGWSTISNNKSIFSKCSHLLKKNNAIVLFPEGSHNIKRMVRPLSKGFTRIVFETLEMYPDIDLKIVPVGLNYEKGAEFYDSVSMYCGKPITANDYLEFNENERVLKLKQDVIQSISKLTTDINKEGYTETLKKLEDLNSDFLNPDEVNNCIASNFTDCKKSSKTKRNYFQLFFSGLFVLSFCVPVLIWRFLIKPKIDEIEFVATIRFVIAITLAPLWLLFITILLMVLFSFSIGIYYLIAVLIITLLAVKL